MHTRVAFATCKLGQMVSPASVVVTKVFVILLASMTLVYVANARNVIEDVEESNNKLAEERLHMRNKIRTLIEDFASRYQSELIQARKETKTECGSFVNVNNIYCAACELSINTSIALLKHGFPMTDILNFTIDACITLHLHSNRICRATVMEFQDEFFGVLTNIEYTTKEVCGFVLAKDCGAPYRPEIMWNITFPDVPKPNNIPPQPPKAGLPTIRVLHLSDIHIDLEYMVGANTDCGEPLCCRRDDGYPLPGHLGAGKYGEYKYCDSPVLLLDSLFQHLSSISDQFDYVIFTGDVPPHNVWNQSRADQTMTLQVFTTYMLKYLPDKKVYSTLGNHESAPVNSFPPPFITGNNSASWLYEASANSWLNWLPQETASTIRKAGFYSVRPFLGLRIISLNMNMCNNGNWWLYVNATDPAGMLQWFVSELQDAENVGDKVHIIGHIMPGCPCCLKPWSWNYYKIVNRYEGTITEQFFGHTHQMMFEMFYDEDNFTRPVGVAYIPGSVTTYSYLNPGFRIYEMDGNYTGSSWRVQDYTNYYLNLTSANIYGRAVWEKEYSAKEAYGMKSLFPDDWNELIKKMKKDDQLFQTFCKHTYKSALNTCDTCDASCRRELLCSLKTGRSGDKNICNDL